ncbi:MAG: type II toxin-antitoxin system RelE/ParE family toxin [Actinomycetota bacterium]|jgi:mRNA interferase RelE/StbE
MAEVRFLDAAIEDLQRLAPEIVTRVLKKLLLLEENPKAGAALGGPLTGYRKLVVGNRDWRIVYRETADGAIEVCEIWAVGARADDEVYQEAAARVGAMGPGPTAHALAQVLARLGHAPPAETAEELPAWLIERLVHTAGLPAADVAKMTPDEALQAWTDYRMRGRD